MRYLALALTCCCLALCGCGGFWDAPEDNSGSTGTSGVGYLYVANGVSTAPSLAAFSVTSGQVNTLAPSPYALSGAPISLAISPQNTWVFVGNASGVYAYSINSDGSLNAANSGAPVTIGIIPRAMQVDPTGQWLLIADTTPSISIFAINTSSGALTLRGHSLQLDSGKVSHLLITPNGTFVFVSLESGGVDILTLDTGGGTLTKLNQILRPKSTGNADYGLASDPNSSYLLVTETGINAVRVLKIDTDGSLMELSTSPTATGNDPEDVMMTAAGTNVYVANELDNTVSAYAFSDTGSLIELSGSPYATGSQPVGIAEDSTHTYVMVICTGGSPDLAIFNTTFDVPGSLSSFASLATAADPADASAIVASH